MYVHKYLIHRYVVVENCIYLASAGSYLHLSPQQAIRYACWGKRKPFIQLRSAALYLILPQLTLWLLFLTLFSLLCCTFDCTLVVIVPHRATTLPCKLPQLAVLLLLLPLPLPWLTCFTFQVFCIQFALLFHSFSASRALHALRYILRIVVCMSMLLLAFLFHPPSFAAFHCILKISFILFTLLRYALILFLIAINMQLLM